MAGKTKHPKKKPMLSKLFRNRSLRRNSFSKSYLIAFALVFACIGGFTIYRTFAAVQVKVWDSQTDFNNGTKDNISVNSDGTFSLPTVTSGTGITKTAVDYENGDLSEVGGGIQRETERSQSDNLKFPIDNPRRGTKSAEIIVHQGDSPFGHNESVEFNRYSPGGGVGTTGLNDEKEGDEYWYRLSTDFEAISTANNKWNLFIQWHGWDDYSPPLGISHRGNSFKINTFGGELACAAKELGQAGCNTIVPGTGKNLSFSYTPTRGMLNLWHDWMFHVKWTSYISGEGVLEIWHKYSDDTSWEQVVKGPVVTNPNDKPWANVIDGTGVTTLHRENVNDKRYGGHIANYLKWGLYRSSYCAQKTATGAWKSGGNNTACQPPNCLNAIVTGYVSKCIAGIQPNAVIRFDDFRMATSRASVDDLMTSGSGVTYPASGSLTLPFDAANPVKFSNFQATDSKPSGTSIAYEARSSCDNVNWSSWGPVSSVPDGRYLQLKANLSTTNNSVTPVVSRLSIDYDGSAACGTPPDPNPPQIVTITQTIQNSTNLSGEVTWAANTSDNSRIKTVSFYVDDVLRNTESTAPWGSGDPPSTDLGKVDTTQFTNGSHTFKAIATLHDNTKVESQSVVTISNEVPQPADPPPTPADPPPVPSDPPPPPTSVPTTSFKSSDLNKDTRIDIYDLSILLTRYGTGSSTGDINGNGSVDIYDLSILLTRYGS